jgi:predicted nucleic acid-binding protein
VRWLLDTNLVSETALPRPNRKVLAWIERQPEDLVAISMVTLAELQDGIISTADDRRRTQLTQWLERSVIPWLGERSLPVTLEILMKWLENGRRLTRNGITRNSADLLIAATAEVHNLTVVSRNARDFAGTGVIVYDPWNGKTHRTELV